MPIANRIFPPDLAPPITQTSLLTAFRDALSSLFGVTPLKSYVVGTEQFTVWQLIGDSTKAFGSAIYRLRVTSQLLVSHAIGSSFTDATNTLVNPSSEVHATTYSSTVAIRSAGFSTPEYRFLSIIQGVTQQLLGYFRPVEAPAYDEASFPRFFIPQSVDCTTVASPSLTPYVSGLSTNLGNTQMANADTYLQLRSQFLGFWIWGANNSGIVANTSIDLASGCCAGMVRGDTFNIPGTNPLEQYYVHRGIAGGLMFRIAGAN